MRNTSTIIRLENTIVALPVGYEVTGRFQDVKLFFNGELLGTFSNKKYAHNAAQRHLIGKL